MVSMKPEPRFSDHRRNRRAQAAIAAGAAGAAGAARTHLRHRKRIKSDPDTALLGARLAGRPVAVRSADGTVLHAEIFGPEGAPTIVLAHGWTEALRLWTHQIRDLSKDFRVVAYDQRGHGASSRAASGEYTMQRLAEDFEAVLNACVPAGERAVVAGHSMGAMTVAAWAESHDVASRIAAVALVNTGVGGLIDDSQLIVVKSAKLDAVIREPFGRKVFLGNPAPMPNISTRIHHAVLRYVAFGPTAGPGQIEFMFGMVRQCRAGVRAAFGRAMADMELHHALARIDVPTIVIAGEKDRLTPVSHARRMAELVAGETEVIVLPEIGHMGPIEAPAAYNAAFRALAARATPQTELALAA